MAKFNDAKWRRDLNEGMSKLQKKVEDIEKNCDCLNK